MEWNDSIQVCRSNEVLSGDLPGEMILLDPEAGVYYGLQEVGAEIWKFIEEPQRLDAIRRHVLGIYDVEPERCQKDIEDLLESLLARKLIDVRREEVR